MKIHWSDRALSDLTDIRTYITQEASEARAIAVLEKILDAVEGIPPFPERGRRVPEAKERADIREIFVTRYRVIYKLDRTSLQIVTVFDGSRDLEGLEPKPW